MLAPLNPSDAPDQQFVAARALLDEILRVPQLAEIFDLDDRPNTKMVYTQAATIWLLILQRLHEVELESGTTLAMVSSMDFDATSMAELYRRRYDVEFDIRDVKVTMDTENIRAKSKEMVMKELMGSIIAYNLVAQFRRSAAKLANVPPRRLSFSGVWLSFQDHLLRKQCTTFEQWQVAFTSALVSASKRRLPVRKEPRDYPRVAHTRRQKSTKFQRSLRKKNSATEEPPPPRCKVSGIGL